MKIIWCQDQGCPLHCHFYSVIEIIIPSHTSSLLSKYINVFTFIQVLQLQFYLIIMQYDKFVFVPQVRHTSESLCQFGKKTLCS